MDLNNHVAFSMLDKENMIKHINGLPDQLQISWELGTHMDLPGKTNFENVVIVGMGGSAIAADLLISYISPVCPIPVIVHRNYLLPGWAMGKKTLVILSSHSGNTEETLSGFNQALQNECSMLAITTGGALAEHSSARSIPVWQYQYDSQPRAAVGFSFGLLLSLFERLNLIPKQSDEIRTVIATMKNQQLTLESQVPINQNPAKRVAGQLINRWVSVFGYGILEPVARRWKTQINEIAKAWSQFDALPETNHNSIAGLTNPQDLIYHTAALFLNLPEDESRNNLRLQLTQKAFMLQGVATDIINATGNRPLSQQWTMLHFGDYLAYYLAMMYDVDPTPIPAIEKFKGEMGRSG